MKSYKNKTGCKRFSFIKRIWPVLFLLFTQAAIGQGGTWVWMKGSNQPYDTGYYGIKGVASPKNVPPYRYVAAHWTDHDGNFWLFGGYYDNTGNYGALNDLWKYDPKSNEWTWVSGSKYIQYPFGNFGTKGVPSVNNFPSCRGHGSATWTDKNGDLWLFGGSGYTSTKSAGTILNDLWKYHIATNEWTWVNGDDTGGTAPIYGIMTIPSAANTPGGRYECNSAWADDSNNLWLFSGLDDYQNTFSDLWKYNIYTNEWTWMKGVTHKNDYGSFGILGVESSTNYPSGRWTVSRWKDEEGNFYVYGGQDFATFQDDIWRYNPKTNNWTWIAGTHHAYPPDSGVFIRKCGHGNSPPGIAANETVQNGACNDWFWSFSGVMIDDYHGTNSLWLFNPNTLKWIWVSGNKYADSTEHYGKMGVPDKLNIPPVRAGCCMWSDVNNNIWIFGGNIQKGAVGESNDLWKFIPDTSCFHPAISNKTIHINDTALNCNDSTYFNLKGLGLHIISVSPQGSIMVKQDTGITFKPQNTTNYVITYYQNECNGFDSLHFKVNVKPCTVPPPVNSYIQTFISSSGIWNIANKTAPLNVTVYDALGQVLYKDSNYQNTLDTRKWAAGVYLYQVIDGNGNMYVGKLVVLRP